MFVRAALVGGLQNGAAPQIVLAATHEEILDLISLETLVEYAVDRPVF
ncbi:hypothetical protein [Chitinibacter bivalviorum]|nr:hypothetical protein [Chitinibacter bivalviorum]